MSANYDSLLVDADALAGEYGVSKDAVEKALKKINGARERFPADPVREMRLALGFALPDKILKLFADEPAEVIADRLVWYDYISSPLTPLYTRPHLTGLLRSFLSYLQRNEKSLLETGHPERVFKASPWLDWHLARTCYTKRPIVIESGHPSCGDLFWSPIIASISAAQNAFRDLRGEHTSSRQYTWPRQYIWPRQRPRPPFRRPDANRQADTPAIQLVQKPFDLDTVDAPFPIPVDRRGVPVDPCDDYWEAGHMQGFTVEHIVWLQEVRPKLLGIKKKILHRLIAALEHRSAAGLWRDASDILTSTLDREEVEKLIGAESLYGSTSHLVLPLWTMDVPPFYENNGGITELLAVIAHVEKELRFGIMHEAAECIGTEQKALQLSMYYQAVGEPWCPKLDQAIMALVELSNVENEFWEEFCGRLQELWPQFRQWVNVRRLVPSDKTHAYRRKVQHYADSVLLWLEQTGEIPDELTSAEAAAGQYVFRKLGDKWQVNFGGQLFYVDDIKGMEYIHTLLNRSGEWVSCMELAGGTSIDPDARNSDIYDDMILEELKNEGLWVSDIKQLMKTAPEAANAQVWDNAIEEQRGKLQAAKDRGDPEEVREIGKHLEQLEQLRSEFFNVRGEERPAERQLENARTNVRHAIDTTYRGIKKYCPELVEYLKAHIKTGDSCVYRAPLDSRIDWKL